MTLSDGAAADGPAACGGADGPAKGVGWIGLGLEIRFAAGLAAGLTLGTTTRGAFGGSGESSCIQPPLVPLAITCPIGAV